MVTITCISEETQFSELLDGVVSEVPILEFLRGDQFTKCAPNGRQHLLTLLQWDIILSGFNEGAIAYNIIIEDPIIA